MPLANIATRMHAAERDRLILGLLEEQGFLSCRELSRRLSTSSATLRRDLDRLQSDGKVVRVHGGARSPRETSTPNHANLSRMPLHGDASRNQRHREAIGRAAAKLCQPGEAVILDGGATTLAMCPHLEPLNLQVLTNSLLVVSALLQQAQTGVSISGGTVLREQNIIIDPDTAARRGTFRASRMFCSAAAVTRHGLMQSDVMVVQAERKLLAQADELIALIDSSQFTAAAGHILCELSQIRILITDSDIDDTSLRMLKSEGVDVIVATTES